jgi:phospholipid/cholesterol/gamma-HCH transport system substrate-binding protein
MRRDATSVYIRFLSIFAVLGVIGIGAVVYILVHERLTLPFQSVYDVRAEFSAADGVLAGTGQPVLVAGVNVGQITGVSLRGGNATATMQLNRGQVPHVYADATATLVPITPLGDMSVELAPGSPPARLLASGTPIGTGQTASPVNASELLDHLDSDTRDYLTALLSSLAQGLGNHGADLRRLLVALGPTTDQLGAISRSLAARRTELAQFVHNLGLLAHASAQDGQIPSAIEAGNRTLAGITSQDGALRQTLAGLPVTLNLARSTLTTVKPFATGLAPALKALSPAVVHLPATLRDTAKFARVATPALRTTIRPLVRHAVPYFAKLSPGITALNRGTPNLTGFSQTFNYALNELGYVPGNGDEGFLFWIPWAFHNTLSEGSTADANGTIARGMYLFNCNGLQEDKQLQSLFDLVKLCPK